ncbi:hypothetical protein CJO92_22650 (plasmid) [Ralstonia solanacearum]|uniref:Uncharacterized protein n=3 Tax=Ralstonia solanacearum species complex TaxID=3116862 RepID=A0AAD0WJD4_RALSL|nr:hypothetical protein B0B51_14815 [blood disease bacterium A2-HR MARDI]AXV84302.1 hypothetical protein CJO77_22635 [Ralstonia solanacearum]AXW55435.1 hypothetical protein CJO92_22650 [Ralstonia solanacearum]CBJ35621.1 conserved hypothethical protein [Ralstonia solanacearum PSI07]CCA81787.1 conserved hypothethical protein [blood disease bacterium R229]
MPGEGRNNKNGTLLGIQVRMPGADSRNNETGVQGHSTWTTTMYALALRASANLCRGNRS